MTLGDRMKILRQNAGLTQEELAQKVGLKKQNISRYENSHCEPNIRTAKRIADALGVSIEEMAVGITTQASKELPPPTGFYSQDELQLIDDYRSLNPAGQEYVRQTMAMAKMSYSEKSNSSSNMEEAE